MTPANPDLQTLERLLDPQRPLPANWQLIAVNLGYRLPPLLKLIAAVAVAGVFLIGLLNATATGLQAVYGLVSLASLIYAGWPLRQLWRVVRNRRAARSGRWRRGVALGPDVLVLLDPSKPLMIGRERIRELRAEKQASASSPSRLVLRYRLDDGRIESAELPHSLAKRRQQGDPGVAALRHWIDQRPAPPTAAASPSAWALHLGTAHLALLALSIAGIGGCVTIGNLIRPGSGLLLGVGLGFPLIFVLPWLWQRLLGARLQRDREGRPQGWAYALLLGIAGMLNLIVGSDQAARAWTLLRASVSAPLSAEAIVRSAGETAFYPWTDALRPSQTLTGYHRYLRRIGESQTVQISYYVASLDQGRGCLWLGLETADGVRTQGSMERLLQARGEWLVPSFGLEQGGFAEAAANAREALPADSERCEPLILLASAAPTQARLAAFSRLLWLQLIFHAVPLLLLGCWGAWQWDRRTLVAGPGFAAEG